jgi:broad specificity phosphatase PhoE
MLILVRHAMPAVSPDVPPAAWTLSADGLRAASAIRSTLPRDSRLVASTEPKAWQTLGAAGEVERDTRFREIDRPSEPWSDDFREVRAEYVSGARHRGWEAHDDVASRFEAGVAAYSDEGPTTLVVASHGMAMTLWLVSVGAVAQAEAAQFWRELRFPDCHLVDRTARSVRRWPPASRLHDATAAG